jgi:hypothetical protein
MARENISVFMRSLLKIQAHQLLKDPSHSRSVMSTGVAETNKFGAEVENGSAFLLSNGMSKRSLTRTCFFLAPWQHILSGFCLFDF